MHSYTGHVYVYDTTDFVFVAGALDSLIACIESPNAREDSSSIFATDNAVSAVAKICKHLDTSVPLDKVLPRWFSWLPVVEDKVEVSHTYSYLCDLIER